MSNNRGISPEMEKELTKVELDAILVFYDFDFTGIGGEQFYLHDGVSQSNKPIVWRGVTYEPYPIEANGFEMSGQGPAPEQTLSVSNLYGLVTGMAARMDGLVGGLVTRRKVYAKYLDAVNFPTGNPQANPSQESISRYFVDRIASINDKVAVIELSSPGGTDGTDIGRTIFANVCSATYRGTCPYRGKPVADRFDMITDDPNKDDCSKTLLGCQARFFANGALPYWGFLSVDKIS